MVSVIGYSGGYGGNVNYNAVVSVENISDGSDLGTEPVTLQEVKDYLRLEGFIDTDESTADSLSDFDYDDNLIEDDIIPAARQMIEQVAGISMIPKTLEAVITNMCGMQEIPYGPVTSVTTLLDDTGTAILSTNYNLVGNTWKYLKDPTYKNMTITYEAGYVTLPKALKLDLLRLIAYMYENRGDDPAIEKFAFQLATKYSRNTPIN